LILAGEEWSDEAMNVMQILMFMNRKCNFFDTIEGEYLLMQVKNYIY